MYPVYSSSSSGYAFKEASSLCQFFQQAFHKLFDLQDICIVLPKQYFFAYKGRTAAAPGCPKYSLFATAQFGSSTLSKKIYSRSTIYFILFYQFFNHIHFIILPFFERE